MANFLNLSNSDDLQLSSGNFLLLDESTSPINSVAADHTNYSSTLLDGLYWRSSVLETLYYTSTVKDNAYWSSTITDKPYWNSI